MARPRLGVLVAVVAAAVVFAGCYGSTEPATKITWDGATLNARGTTNNGQAESWFELWQTAGGTHSEVGHQTWPGGVSGPFSHTQTGLASDTDYSFRMCGRDVGGEPACAQTRTFRTTDGDSASGAFGKGDFAANFTAWSGPNGERPDGSEFACISGSVCHRFDFDCLKVSGTRAITGSDADGLFEVQAGDPGTIAFPPSGSNPTCATASFDDFVVDPSWTVRATVHDAP